MSISADPRGERITHLQSLRFVAAFVVLVGHVLMEARQHGMAGIPDWLYDLPWGNGVDIFFVISGFIIFHIGKGLPQGWASASDFFMRRLIRIVPLYWFFTFAMVLAATLFPASVQNSYVSVGSVLKSLLFVPFGDVDTNLIRPVLAQGWTLVFEMFFYLCFGLAVAITSGVRRFYAINIFIIGFVMLGVIGVPNQEVTFLSSPMLLLFCLGLLLSMFWHKIPKHNGYVALALVVASLLAMAFIRAEPELDHWVRFRARGIPSFVLVYAILFWKNPPNWLTRGSVPLLGDASYALYLSHPFVINAALLAFTKSGLPVGTGFILLSSTAAVLASVLVFLWMERPAMNWGNAAYKASALGQRLRSQSRAPASPEQSAA